MKNVKKKIYSFARDRMPEVIDRVLRFPQRFLPEKHRQLYLLAVEAQAYQQRLQLLRSRHDWEAWLDLVPTTDTALLVHGEQERDWADRLVALLRQQGTRVTKAVLARATTGLTSEQRFPLMLQGMDWREDHFPSEQRFALALLSPTVAVLNHRPAFLLWLRQRYRITHFLLRLPLLCRYDERVYRSRLSAPPVGQRTGRQSYQVLYTPRSAHFEFSSWFRMKQLRVVEDLGELWALLGERERQPGEEEMVSVVVPAYRVEAFLPQCLRSLLAQSWSRLEVLVVDDASPDRCAQIANEHARRDPRVRVLRQASNQGQAAARNLGLAQAKGEFICFVDGDDFVHPRYLETLALALRESGADFVVCDIDEAHDPGPNIHCYRHWERGDATPLPFESPYLRNAPWDKMFRVATLRAKKLTFPQGHYYEDLPYTHALSCAATRHFYLPCTLIHYRHHDNSESRAILREKNVVDHCRAVECVKENLRQAGKLSDPLTLPRYWGLVLHHLDKLLGAEMLGRPKLDTSRRHELAALAWTHSIPLWYLDFPLYRSCASELFQLDHAPTRQLAQLRQLHQLLSRLQRRQLSLSPLPDVFPRYW